MLSTSETEKLFLEKRCQIFYTAEYMEYAQTTFHTVGVDDITLMFLLGR
jgi:hypothetical protein